MSIMKKLLAIVLAVLMIAGGLYLVPADGDKVQASTAIETLDSGAVVLGTDELKEGTVGADVTPVPKDEAYADYLFAGWFTSKECSIDTAVADKTQATLTECYAKFMPKEVLSVKLQIAGEDVTDENSLSADSAIRFISSVESLDYNSIGFEISYDENSTKVTKPYTSKDVYEKIDSTLKENGNKKEYTFSPKVVSAKSEYFFTAKLGVSAANVDTDYTVQAFWITLDGTKVYGDSRCVCVNDNAANVINIPVEAKLDTTKTYTATSTNNTVTNVKVLSVNEEYSNVRLTVANAVDTMPSATKIVLNDGTSDVATAIYRNYYTTHVIEGSEEVNADTTWYEAYKENDGTSDYLTTDHFVIASSADLYGLAKIVNGSDNYPQFKFSNVTITLIKDIEINSGNSENWGTTAPDYMWTPIGKNDATYGFRGTFDGDDNAIQGVYYYKKNASSNTETNAGLFGFIHSSCTIKNLRLVNSYIEVFNGAGIGGVVGTSNGGKIQNVYSSATVKGDANSNSVGQFVGLLKNAMTLENCWSDGTVLATNSAGSGATYVGGFIGYTKAASKTITANDCLHTGTVQSSRTTNFPRVGGFCGFSDQASTQFNFSNYLEAGNVIVAKATMVGSVFGQLNSSNGKAIFTNSYSASNLTDGTSTYTYVIHWKATGVTFTNLPTATSLETLSAKTVVEMFGNDSSAWEKVTGETPFILSHFKEIWEAK